MCEKLDAIEVVLKLFDISNNIPEKSKNKKINKILKTQKELEKINGS